MRAPFQLAAPPAKPLLIFDGDCRFCSLWVRRWQRLTADKVDYAPFQAPDLLTRFPELSRATLQSAVHLLEPDGSVYFGAEAVFRALAKNPRENWWFDWYAHSPRFARAAEWTYAFVAEHRGFFSAVTRLGWGSHLEPPTHQRVRWVFLRALGLVYLCAFLSLWSQVTGLVGERGILPAQLTMAAVRQQLPQSGWGRYHLFPTLCWLDAGDRSLQAQGAAGVALAVLLVLDVAPVPCLALLWLLYLSLSVIGRDFLGFQWDALLLETGFLAIFLAPIGGPNGWLRLMGRARRQSLRVSPLSLWLLRWLLFRLMFASGCVKLLSGDPTWRNLTALQYHYETQPLPTWIGWFAFQAPPWFQRASTGAMFAVELVLPFFIFGPRRFRQLAAAGFVFLQILILLTGNYCFFNFLTIALCVLLLDDAALRRRRRKESILEPLLTQPTPQLVANNPPPSQAPSKTSPLSTAAAEPKLSPSARLWNVLTQLQRLLTFPVAGVFVLFPLLHFAGMFKVPVRLPERFGKVDAWLAPFRSCNHYGLFAVMTTNRLEISVEASNDGLTWLPYEFKYKPGPLDRRPRFVEPFQPRLDWQMWFAALSDYRNNPWFVDFCVRLLQGSPEVLALLQHQPFPTPPRYVRATLYEYHFTTPAVWRRTGAWWTREPLGLYLPPISLRSVQP